MKAMGIGTLAKRAGVRIDTVRYYERSGLLKPRGRLASGYRQYTELELARLGFIRRAQALGFSLHEASDLLALSAQRDVGRVRRSAQAKLADVQARIAALTVCPHSSPAARDTGRAEDCPILKALGGEES